MLKASVKWLGKRTNLSNSSRRSMQSEVSVNEEILKNSSLNRFILRKTDSDNEQPNRGLSSLYDNFHLDNKNLLPLVNPLKVNPFSFYSTHNEGATYVLAPRLSVTKLLTNQWCELREYYNIFAGSPIYDATRQIKLGSTFHEALELETHEPVKVYSLIEGINKIVQRKKDAGLTLPYYVSVNLEVSSMAEDLANKVIHRLFTLLLSSEAREVLVHGIINLEEKVFIQHPEKIADKSAVLVTGIIDKLEISGIDETGKDSLLEEINQYIERNFCKFYGDRIIDLSAYFDNIHEIISRHTSVFTMKISDVKTRSVNKIPSQDSVLSAARDQTFFYRKFFGILAGEDSHPRMAYYSLMKSLEVKDLSLDEPINFKTLLVLIRSRFGLLYNDFKNMAYGRPLRFEPYDSHAYLNCDTINYDLSDFLNMEDITTLNRLDPEFDYNVLKPLLRKWNSPPTLRYFIARSSQFYTSFKPLLSEETSVEYHNAQTGNIFHTNRYKYNSRAIQEKLVDALGFWNGERDPSHTTDLSKCYYCQYQSKCMVPNIDSKDKVGHRVVDFTRSR